MKIKFEENLDYQLEAINSITDIFAGQEVNKTLFTVEKQNGQNWVQKKMNLGQVMDFCFFQKKFWKI